MLDSFTIDVIKLIKIHDTLIDDSLGHLNLSILDWGFYFSDSLDICVNDYTDYISIGSRANRILTLYPERRPEFYKRYKNFSEENLNEVIEQVAILDRGIFNSISVKDFEESDDIMLTLMTSKSFMSNLHKIKNYETTELKLAIDWYRSNF